jgi:hypothetical protein
MTHKLLLSFLALSFSPVLAHELVRDGNVAALMHTDPDDAPLVAKPTAVFFELNQRGGKAIPLAQCACTLNVYAGSVRAGARPVIRGALRQGKGQLLSSVTFPAAGAYTMVLQGKPKSGTPFPPFKLSWAVRADVMSTGGTMQH